MVLGAMPSAAMGGIGASGLRLAGLIMSYHVSAQALKESSDLCAQVLKEQELCAREAIVLLAAEDLKEMQVTIGTRPELLTAIKSLLMRPEEVVEHADPRSDQRVHQLKEWGLEDTADALTTSLTREGESLRRLRILDREAKDIMRELKDLLRAVKTEEAPDARRDQALAKEMSARLCRVRQVLEDMERWCSDHHRLVEPLYDEIQAKGLKKVQQAAEAYQSVRDMAAEMLKESEQSAGRTQSVKRFLAAVAAASR